MQVDTYNLEEESPPLGVAFISYDGDPVKGCKRFIFAMWA